MLPSIKECATNHVGNRQRASGTKESGFFARKSLSLFVVDPEVLRFIDIQVPLES